MANKIFKINSSIKFLNIIFVLFISEVGLSATTREACSNVRVDTAHMPLNQDQRRSGACSFYAAANFLSFYTKQRISPIGLASRHYTGQSYNMSPKNDLQFLNPSGDGFFYIMQTHTQLSKNLCAESNFSFNSHEWVQQMDSYIEVVSGLNSSSTNRYNGTSIRNSLDLAKEIDKQCKVNVAKPQGYFMRQTYDGITDLYSPMNNKAAGLVQPHDFNIHKVLSNKEPVLIFYYVDFLKYGKSTSSGLHESVLIGRRYNNENLQCEFLIKNSWGSNCNVYSPVHRNYPNCENGNVWVSEEELYENLISYIAYLGNASGLKAQTCDYRDINGQCYSEQEWKLVLKLQEKENIK